LEDGAANTLLAVGAGGILANLFHLSVPEMELPSRQADHKGEHPTKVPPALAGRRPGEQRPPDQQRHQELPTLRDHEQSAVSSFRSRPPQSE
jgi:hypothetical protein